MSNESSGHSGAVDSGPCARPAEEAFGDDDSYRGGFVAGFSAGLLRHGRCEGDEESNHRDAQPRADTDRWWTGRLHDGDKYN